MARRKRKEILPMLQEMGVDLDEPTQKIIKILEKQKLVSENRIAKRLKLKINSARKLLYRLQSRGLITYVKKRDEKKKWWYLYFWFLDMNRITELYVLHLKKKILRKKIALSAESEFVFECNICSQKYSYEDALETEFACPQCGELLTEIKDGKASRRIKVELTALQIELEEALLIKPRPKPIIEKPKRRRRKKAVKKQVKKKIRARKKVKKKKKIKKRKKKLKKTKPKKRLKKVKKKSKPKKKKVTAKRVAKRVLRKILLRKKKRKK